MKILHTSDWHLGQKLRGHIRDKEHRLVFDWLIEVIQQEKIDVLVVSGDIFDVMNPPNSSRKLYYQFLARVVATNCRHVVIVGGNHDAPSMLNAPKDLLENFQIHVVGAVTQDLRDELILLKDENGIEAVVAAVPFLRDQDLRKSIAGEEETDIYKKIQQGIYQHYKEVGQLCEEYKDSKIPIIATGHLYASGSTTSGENQDNIYLGNVENISSEHFSSIFDYVALGHIHTAQPIGQRHIRYSGSIIPLSFSEIKDTKSVTIIDFSTDKEKSPEIKLLKVPTPRKLIELSGDYEEVLLQLEQLPNGTIEFKHWLKIEILVEEYQYGLEEDIQALCKEKNMELIIFKIKSTTKTVNVEYDYTINLNELRPIDIFKNKLEAEKMEEEKSKELEQTFKELLGWMQDNEIDTNT